MSSTISAPTDNPPVGCGEVEFAEWAAEFRKRRTSDLVAQGVHARQIRPMVDLEVECARRRSRPIESEVRA